MTDSTDNARGRLAAYLDYINEMTPNGNTRITNAMLCAGNEKRQQDHIEAQMKLAFDAGWQARADLAPAPLRSAEPDDWPETVHVGKAVVRFPNGVESGSWYSKPNDEDKTVPFARADLASDPLRAVKVRALEWDGLRAGPYWIEVEAGGLAHLFCDYDRTDDGVEPIKGGFLTLVSIDDLKAAAQADYEQRIRSALEPDPQDARVAALVEARKRHIDAVNAYNAKLEAVKEARCREDWTMSAAAEFMSMHEANREFIGVAQRTADALAAVNKGGKDE